MPAETQLLINSIHKNIDDAIASFNESMPAIQSRIYNRLLLLLKELELSGGQIKNSVANTKAISVLKNDIENIILNPKYISSVSNFSAAFNAVSSLQNNYFKALVSDFSPVAVLDAIKTDAIDATVTSLTEAGISFNVTEAIQDILRQNITTGASFGDMVSTLKDFITGDKENLGVLEKYTKQITTDSLNQYSRIYNHTIASDLSLEWRQFVGSNLRTTRPFCKAMTEMRYFHDSQLEDILNGDIDGHHIFISDKTGVWAGGIPGTNAQNFMSNAGGYNCGHGIYYVTEALVPLNIRMKVYREKGIPFDAEGFRIRRAA